MNCRGECDEEANTVSNENIHLFVTQDEEEEPFSYQ